jgi:hypothetical protein
VDAANCTDLDGNAVDADQRGVPRSGKCDIGAFEYDGADYLPAAVDDILLTRERAFELDLLENDRDANADELFVSEISEPEHGILSFGLGETDGKRSPETPMTYTPDEDFLGMDTFRYEISDGKDVSEAWVVVLVRSDMLPEVQDDEATTVSGAAVRIDVLANDSDPEGNPLSISEVSEPANGSAVIEGDVLVYTSDPDFVGTDSFRYRVSDGAKTGKAIVTVVVEEAPLTETWHSADFHEQDHKISLSELLRVIQLFTNDFYICGDTETEDGYDLEVRNPDIESHGCRPHDADYAPQDWRIDLLELLRVIQFYNSKGYVIDPESEDGFAPAG